MGNTLRSMLQLDPPAQAMNLGGGDDLQELIEQMKAMQAPPAPMMPMPRRMPPPEMPQQSFGDILPQILAGVGDVFSAGARRPSSYLGQVAGLQQARRAEAYNAARNRQDVDYWNENAARQEQMFRQQLSQRSGDQLFSQRSKLAELMLLQQQLGKGRDDQADARFAGYKAQLSKVADRKSLKLEADKLRALNPKDRAAIDQAEEALGGVFDIQAAQPNKLQEQLGAMGVGGTLQRMKEAAIDPIGGQGFPVLNAERGYRALYATPFSAVVPGVMDLGEAAGLWNLGTKPGPGGRLQSHPLDALEQSNFDAHWLQRRMQQQEPSNPFWDWARNYRGGY